MAEQNPFASLVMTPENLSLMRQVRFDDENKGENFWVRSAGRAGLEMRQSLLNRGIALGPEDKRAIDTQAIMAGAQKRLADLVKTGSVDPLDAQETVITETMSAFMQAGDYQAAQSLLPGLNQIRTYRGEMDKLRSESEENRAQAYSATSAGDVRYARTPAQIDADRARAKASLAAGRASDARARLADRTDPNLRKGRSGSGEDAPSLSAAAEREHQQAIAGTLTLFDTMNDLIQIVEQSPAALSAGAGVQTDASRYIRGFQEYLQQRGSSVGGFQSLSSDPAATVEGNISPKELVARNRARIDATAKSLGVDRTLFESTVIDAAYALARANDPGGRLSNNDFDFSLRMLGAVQDPASARASFANLARRTIEKHRARMRSIGSKNKSTYFSEQDADVEGTYASFEKRYGQLGRGPESKPTDDGWIDVPGGGRVRVKPTK